MVMVTAPPVSAHLLASGRVGWLCVCVRALVVQSRPLNGCSDNYYALDTSFRYIMFTELRSSIRVQ